MLRAIVAAVLCALSVPALAQNPPNVVIVLTDDTGLTMLAGRPNVERIRAVSADFAQHDGEPICSPTRAALLFGRHPQREGADQLFGPGKPSGASLSGITIAELLRDGAGYNTGLVGKYHLGEPLAFGPHHQGFNFTRYLPTGHTGSIPLVWRDGDTTIFTAPHGSPAKKAEMAKLTSRTEQHAMEFLGSTTEPFLLEVSEPMMHTPQVCQAKLPAPAKETVSACAARELDASIGRLYDYVTAVFPNTYFILLSDNGGTGAPSNGTLRGAKGSYFEGGFRAMAMVAGPGITPKTIAAPVAVWDWFPTIAGLAGVALPTDRTIDGRDLWPLIQGTGVREGGDVFWWRGALREGCLKFVLKGNKAPADLLFDVCADQNETAPLADPVTLAAMKARHKATTPKKGLL